MYKKKYIYLYETVYIIIHKNLRSNIFHTIRIRIKNLRKKEKESESC